MSNALSISRLVNVSVDLSPQAAQSQNLSALLILGSSNVINTQERIRSYNTIDAVASDFDTTSPEYLSAVLWFEQSPTPRQLYIGRWADAATAGSVVGATLSQAEQALSNFTGVTDGGFTVTVDSGSPTAVTGLNFAAATNLNGVASAITTALGSAATCTWDATYGRFTITSATTGAASAVSFLTAPASGTTDIGSLLGLTASNSGAYVVAGIVAETALEAVTLFDGSFGSLWYAVTVLGIAPADHDGVAGFIQAATTKHLYGVSTQEAATLVAGDATSVASRLKALSYSRSIVQFSSSNPYAVCSLLGRLLTVDYTGSNTTITLMYKQEPGIVPEALNSTQMDALLAKNANVFVVYDNNTAIIQPGVVSSGDFADTITGTDWFAVDVQTTLYNLLFTSNTKIPQTDAGMHLLATGIESICSQGVNNGLLAPGVWNSSGFGGLTEGDYLDKGFYVYAPPVASQSVSDRAARKAVLFQVAAKLAGAVHSVDIVINVNQ